MPKLTEANKKTIADFNKLWHESIDGTWHKMRWMGVKALKTPTDFWIYQELITSIKPKWIIETGTCFGGSALYMGHVCDALGRGRVLSIDIHKPKSAVKHPRVMFYQGSSIAPETIKYVRSVVKDGPVLVILDSNHKKAHVLKEMLLYGPMVTPGSYMIVEDTDINKTVRFDHGPGPGDAVDEFMKTSKRFVVDEDCERYYLTFHPGGYLKCVR
jgi:cephalosporin hydroxylase